MDLNQEQGLHAQIENTPPGEGSIEEVKTINPEVEPNEVDILIIKNTDINDPDKDEWKISDLAESIAGLASKNAKIITREHLNEFMNKRTVNRLFKIVIIGNNQDVIKPSDRNSSRSIAESLIQRKNAQFNLSVIVPADNDEVSLMMQGINDERLIGRIGMGRFDNAEEMRGEIGRTLEMTLKQEPPIDTDADTFTN